ncbi:hypothetical protein CP520_01550 [Mesoplasma lactucae ATCC 49193]|uniref:J domain-containing protein n=2 Tax=Mesoplasma lactucae TaxID=138853 RepID=A0A291ISN3_9MOLU|nr:hypothetical protein CP520_01550 [Mesoplasma lactucae ATCC 49193]
MMLGLTSPVTIKEIKQAYKKLAKQYHPDLNKDNPIAEKKMQMITTAYNFLKNKW